MHNQSKKICDSNPIGGFCGALIAIALIFFVVPVFEKNFYTHLLLQCNFILLILSTIYTIDRKQTILTTGLLLLIPFIYLDSLSFLYHSIPYLIAAYSFSLGFILLAIYVLMKKILHTRAVDVNLIFGSLMVYLLSGILWANIYFIENMVSTGSFQGTGLLNFEDISFLDTYEQQFNFLYYSFATLATLGMGDITPMSHLAKSLTAMEAMFGQLFVAIIIAKLVSVWWHVPEKK